MKVVLKTDEYTIFQRRDERYAVKDAERTWVNGDAKIAILLEHKLIEAAAPKQPEPDEAPVAEKEEVPVAEKAPAAEEEEAPVAEEAAAPEVVAGSETILLVEDDESVRLLIRRTLEKSGFRVAMS